MASETDLQKSILEALEAAGYWAWRVNSGGRQGRVRLAPDGTPDICVVSPAGWLEVKLPGKKLRESQKLWHARARRLGARVEVVTSVGEALETVSVWAERDNKRDVVLMELMRLAGEP